MDKIKTGLQNMQQCLLNSSDFLEEILFENDSLEVENLVFNKKNVLSENKTSFYSFFRALTQEDVLQNNSLLSSRFNLTNNHLDVITLDATNYLDQYLQKEITIEVLKKNLNSSYRLFRTLFENFTTEFKKELS